MLAIDDNLKALASTRPCFHSKADFQFALGWQLKQDRMAVDVRFDVPSGTPGRRDRLDLLILEGSLRIAVKIRYWHARLATSVFGEAFELGPSEATDFDRYDAMRDLQGLEDLLSRDQIDRGYLLALTNNYHYWSRRTGNGLSETCFALHQGRTLAGQLGWGDSASSIPLDRRSPISLLGDYPIDWQPYSTLDITQFGTFHFLLLRAQRKFRESEPAGSQRSPGVRPSVGRFG